MTGHNGNKLTNLLKEPLTNWQNAGKRLEDHDRASSVHRDSVLRASCFEEVMLGKSDGRNEQAVSLLSKRVKYNRCILRAMFETVILCDRKNLALRGHRDDSSHYSSSNPGNFHSLLDYRISSGDKVLAEQLKLAKKTATYRSKTIQNKLVTICGKQICDKTVSAINDSDLPIYSVLADEAADC